MGTGIVTVGRRQYAVGLYWENSPSGRVTQAAKEAALQPGQKAEFFAIRSGTKDGRVPQFGLASGSAGFKSGMAVFAGCLVNQQPGSWAGAFHFPGGTVVTVVRDELIVPDGDQFYVNESEARDRLLQEVGFGGLLRIYAPESWAITGADTMPVSLLLNDRHDIRLRPAEIPKKMIYIAAGGVAVLLLALGVGWYVTVKQEEDERLRIEQEAALQRVRDAASKLAPSAINPATPNYPAPERRWEQQPLPLVVIEACRAGLGEIPAAIAGWHLTQLKCDGKSISFTLAHDNGIAAVPKQASINETAASAERNVALTALATRQHEDLLDPKDITARYLTQGWPGTIGRAPDDPPPSPPADYKGAWAPPPPPWVKRSFTFTVHALPGNLAAYFTDLPGAVINSLTYSTGGSWTIEGVIYENRV